MKTHCRYTGIKGFVTVWQDAIRYGYMITKEAEKKAKILVFWEKHGLVPTIEAFEVKRRTLFDWKAKWINGGKKIESLNDTKRTPQTKRKRAWNLEILSEIKRQRFEHPNLGKEKIYPELKEFCDTKNLACPK